MRREVGVQDLEKVHEAGRKELRVRHVAGKGQARAESTEQAGRPQRVRKGRVASCLAKTDVPARGGIDDGDVIHVEVPLGIDQDGALIRLLRERVVPDQIMRKVVDDLEGEEEARRRHVRVPVEDGPVDDGDPVAVDPRRRRLVQVAMLQRHQGRRDLDDAELRARVHLRVHLADVVEDVQHQRAVAGAHLVDDEIVVRVQRELVVRDQIPRDGLAVERTEQLRRCVPQLPGRVPRLGIQRIFKGGVPLRQLLMELGLVLHLVELERFSGGEDDDLLAEVAIVGIVQAIYTDLQR